MLRPVVIAPAPTIYSWTGPYAGVSAGTTRTKTQHYITEQRQETRPYTKADAFRDARARGLKLLSPEEPLGHCQAFGYISLLGCNNFSQSDYIYGDNTQEDYRNYFGDFDNIDDLLAERYEGIEVAERGPVVTSEWSEVVGTKTVTENHFTLGAFTGYRWQTSSSVVFGAELAYHHYDGTGSTEAKAQVGYAINRALPYFTTGYDMTGKSALYGVGFDYALTDRWVTGLEFTHGEGTSTDRLSAKLALRF